MHFPAGQLPPNNAFWSLAATDTGGYMVSSSTGRSIVNSHSGLVTSGNRNRTASRAERAVGPCTSEW
ncbi:DUF1214 domain-containing protein [Parafrigoribacterium mesophilum]|uniref:DUF1214 domain-containing protein n=1 Tax=Parafrigoribacterium mesophilum TaxID=433646 RepID=UPI003D15D7F0